VEEGVPISRVDEALRLQSQGPAAVREQQPDVWRGYREEMIAAVTGFDETGLEEVYSDALALYPVDVVTRRLLVPLLRELGERWADAEGSVAEEHFFATYLRNKLGARFHHRRRHAGAPRLLAACLPGEHHEIGLLLFALAAHDRGYELILLGADMPIEELPAVARRTHCQAIVLSGSVEPWRDVLERQLGELVSAVRSPVFVGGRTAVRHAETIQQAGAIPLGDDIVLGLKAIARHLNPSTSVAR
jgi:methanogenic corrinoid protein MtbC1